MLDCAAPSGLAAVTREGSFERVALVLDVTPSAVSQRTRLLEERVGCALVVRGQPCGATDTGRRLCQQLDRLRLLEQELQGTLPALAPEGIARLSLPVAVNADSLATWLAPAVAAFVADAPVLMKVAVDDEDCTAEWLRSGAVPVAACTALSQRHDSTARSRPPRPAPALPIPHLRQRPLALQLPLDAVVEFAAQRQHRLDMAEGAGEAQVQPQP